MNIYIYIYIYSHTYRHAGGRRARRAGAGPPSHSESPESRPNPAAVLLQNVYVYIYIYIYTYVYIYIYIYIQPSQFLWRRRHSQCSLLQILDPALQIELFGAGCLTMRDSGATAGFRNSKPKSSKSQASPEMCDFPLRLASNYYLHVIIQWFNTVSVERLH